MYVVFYIIGDFELLKDLFTGCYWFVISNVGDHLGYIIFESDFNICVSFFVDWFDGDHYEEIVVVFILVVRIFLEVQFTI